jgi:hypothetical protein
LKHENLQIFFFLFPPATLRSKGVGRMGSQIRIEVEATNSEFMGGGNSGESLLEERPSGAVTLFIVPFESYHGTISNGINALMASGAVFLWKSAVFQLNLR